MKRFGTLVIVTAMLAVVVLVTARLWAHGERNAMPLLWQVSQSADGRVFVLLGTDLHVESPSSGSLGTIDLMRLGVQTVQGDFAVLSDNTIILPQGQLPPVTLRENLQVTAGTADERNTPSEPLMRCSLETFDCDLLAADPDSYRAGRAFRLAVNETRGRIVVADTARHRLLLLNMEGRILDRMTGRFSFPNQLQFTAPDAITVADTRKSRLATVAVGDEKFGDIVGEQGLDCWPGSLLRRYPSGFVQAADGARWAIVAMTDMTNGALYRLAQNANCAEQIALPPNADPFFLLATSSSVLVPDAATYRIHQFALNGESLTDFGSPALVARLGELAQRKTWLTTVFNASLWVLLAVALPMLLIGYKLHQRAQVAAAGDWQQATIVDEREITPEPAQRAPALSVELSPQQHLQDIRGEHEFRRRWTGFDTQTSFELFVWFGIVSYTILGIDIWLRVTRGGSTEGLLSYILHSNGFLAMLVVITLGLIAWILTFTHERLVIDRSGVHYTSFLNGPLGILNRYHPDWSMRWDEIQSVRIKTVGSGWNVRQWFFEIADQAGRTELIQSFFWRAAGRPDGGLKLKDIRVSSGIDCGAALGRTKLYQVFAPHLASPRDSTAVKPELGGAADAPYPAEYYDAYVGPRAERYLRVWSGQGFRFPRPGFNFPAFLIGPIWAGYRKMYPLVLSIGVVGGLFWTLIARAETWLALEGEWHTYGATLVFSLGVALIADSVYLHFTHLKIRTVLTEIPDTATRVEALRKQGGTSVAHAIAATLLAGVALRVSERLFGMLIPELGQ